MERNDNIAKANAEFGERLLELIKKRKITQAEFAKRTRQTKCLTYAWTTGHSTMKISSFAQIADAMDFTTAEICYLLEPYFEVQ